jgi:hypothetical protein
MASFANKLANSITSKGSVIIGRGPLTKLTNGINKALFKNKYREYMKPGNLVQICSKTSHCSLQICQSRNDAQRLILMGNGPIGKEHNHAHFLIEKDKNENLKFRNGFYYLAFDNDIPTILSEPTHPNAKKHEFIRARNEFRLHEIIGSDEHFALESIYSPGRYLSILQDGSITMTRDKSNEMAHFFLKVIAVNGVPYQEPITGDSNGAVISRPESVYNPPGPSSYGAGVGAAATVPSFNNANSKQQESEYYERERAAAPAPAPAPETPPTYSNLFPQLPK